MAERRDNYWSRRLISRRGALRGAGLGAAGLAGVALFGCGGDDGGSGDTAGTTAPSGGDGTATAGEGGRLPSDQIRIAPGAYENEIPATPGELDPANNARYGGTLMARYLDPPHMDFNRTLSCTVNSTMDFTKNKLVRAKFGPTANNRQLDMEPDLAESWETTPDGLTWTFHLHQGVKFHNVEPTMGREFTSDDVRVSIERYQAGGVQKDMWSDVTSIETPDNYTVVLTLGQPISDFTRNIAAWSHMDAKEMLEDIDFLTEHAVGTGPFIQETWVQKERSEFVKHPDYFEEGLPYLDRVITVVQNDLAVQRAGYLTDNWFYWGARDDDEAAIMLDQSTDSVYLKDESVVGANTSGFHFQMTNPKFQDERVRRAFALGLDFVEWDLARYNGEAGPGGFVQSPIPWPYLHESRPDLTARSEWYQYDLEQSRQLLQAAGYSESNPIVVDFPAWYLREEYAAIMGPMYELIPEIVANVRQVDNPTAVSMLNARNFEDTMNITWGPPVYSVDQAVYPWYHSQGGLNHNNVNDAEMDRLVTAQRQEQDQEAKVEIWRDIETRIYDQVWDVFFPTGTYRRTFWHNYMINMRPASVSATFSCYGDGKARSVWLDEGAPTTYLGNGQWGTLI